MGRYACRRRYSGFSLRRLGRSQQLRRPIFWHRAPAHLHRAAPRTYCHRTIRRHSSRSGSLYAQRAAFRRPHAGHRQGAMTPRRIAKKPAPAFVDPTAFTPHFTWQSRGEARRRGRDEIYCENVLLSDVTEKYGTPTYLYSGAAITDAYRELHRGLQSVPHTLCFAVKSNGNLAILQQLAKLGSGFDIVSGGELYRLAQIGVPGKRIVFSGVGKTREEIREALQYRVTKRSTPPGILLFNVESEAELEVLLEESSRA